MLRGKIVQTGLVLGAIFAATHIFFPVTTIAQVASYTLLAIGLTVVAYYIPLTWHVVTEHRNDRSAQLIVGITISWLSLTLASFWTIMSYITGDRSMLTHPIIGGYIFGYILGGILHITASRDSEGRIPLSVWTTLWVALATGTIMGILTVVLGLERGLAASSL